MGIRRVVAVLAIAPLGLVACSGGSDDSGGSVLAGTGSEGASRSVTADLGPPATFADHGTNPVVEAASDSLSTFAIDVDTGSYTLARAFLRDGYIPDPVGVRTEEFVNYFDQEYEPPDDGLAVHVDGTAVPFLGAAGTRVVRVGLQSAVVEDAARSDAVLTFVIDVSGSMAQGGRLETVKSALRTMVGELRPSDEVGIVVYSDDTRQVLPHTPVADIDGIVEAIDSLRTEGSTNAEAGLLLGYERARASFREGAVNRVVLASDGVANVGETGPDKILAKVRDAAGKGIDLVTVGVGVGNYNDVLMEQLANDGDGFYAYVDGPREAERLFVHDLTSTLQVAARDAKVQVEFDPAQVTTYRLLGYENRDVADDAFRDDAVDGGEVGAGHSVTALYEIVLAEGAGSDAPIATATVRYQDPVTGEAIERTAQLEGRDIAAQLSDADPRLHLDVLVAAYAEALRGGPWNAALSLEGVARNAGVLDGVLGDDPDVVEFAELARHAADLSR
jgi:Ca-activated chloride channel family protein